MKKHVWVALLTVAVVFSATGLSWASSLSPENVMTELKSIGKVILGGVFLIFLAVGGYTIVQSLVDARKQGGWGHVVVGIAMVLVAGLALWTLTSLSNQEPGKITDTIKIDK